ncbi:hypothetical protein JRO89_XS04G0277700 [Xanthoceras sorbifolium]|uniref:DUF4378 domain-containing protein n=1 Tax=Xanthoceras sorbifolium TaxID=99658 RepID=A0ABQ8I7I8_9ROSI|nr:hypothetical protein JRO89_XS04G0277700 [Xanthoceras sorbifolium]
MHPDSLKSVVYRSFVTCDDPKGVVECGTIRKSKSSSRKMEHKINSRKAKKKSDASLSYKAEKKEETLSEVITEEFHNPSSFQLLEVSRGAQKLNRMIDSWSKGKSYDGQSKDVAKDLLKGALDLQESLVMLGKLQEASQYKAWLKKKQKEMSKIGKNDEVGIERANSYHFGDRNYQMEFQKPRLSTDGASRDCFDELREVIRDSLAKQNLLPKTDSKEMMDFHQRHLDSSSDIPSTSSSQSSITHTSNYSSTASPFSFTAPEKKAKGPNLIAKLMGLEEIPLNPLQSTLHKQKKDEKFSSQQRSFFDYDMPKIRKPQFVRQHQNPERKTLKEILETMHFTGILKGNSVNDLQYFPHQSSDLHSKERLIGSNPPIVLIKPRCDQFFESEETFVPVIQEKGVQDTKLMLRKLKVKEELPSRTNDCKEGTLNSGKTNRKKGEENSIRRLSEEGAKKSKDMIGKLIKQKGCDKVNSSGHVTHQPQKKEAIDKKADKIPKTIVRSRKPTEKEVVKSKNVSRSEDQAKVTAMNVRKSNNGSNVSKNQILRQPNSTLNAISNRTKQTVNNISNDRKKPLITKEKPVSEPTAAKLTTGNVGCREDDKRINFTCKDDSILVEDNNKCVDQLPAEKVADASEFQITECCNNSQSSLCEANLLISEYEREINFFEENKDDISQIRLQSKSLKNGTNLKAFLSSSPGFLSHAEELFDLNVDNHTNVRTSKTNDFVISNERLSIDSANEIMERRSIPDSKTSHPLLLTWLRIPRIHLSLDDLLEEVCDGVETLRSYTKLAGDSLYAVLERDIGCNGIVSGIWDLGWRNELSADDIEKVVNDIEKLLFSGLIDEIFT